MDYGLTEAQEVLRRTVADFLENECPLTVVRELESSEEGYSPELYKTMGELGILGLLIPEEYGGAGGHFADLSLVMEELGKALYPSPFYDSTVIGGRAILALGTEEQKRELLPQIVSGDLKVTLALKEIEERYDAGQITLKAERVRGKDEYLLNGTKLFVSFAHVADQIMTVARTATGSVGVPYSNDEGITLFLVDRNSPGVTMTLLQTLSGEKLCEVVYDNVRVPASRILGPLHKGWSTITRIVSEGEIAKCAEMVGMAQAAIDMGLEYVKERVQFGQPIGRFQAIQHKFSDATTEVDGARILARRVAWSIGEEIPCNLDMAMAKNWTGEACRHASAEMQQVMGGYGFIMEYDMQLHFRRIKTAEANFCDPEHQRDIIAAEMNL